MSVFNMPIQVPYSLRIADQKKMDQYNTQIDQYTNAMDKYKADIAAYNKAVDDYNAGKRESEFTMKQPTAPAEPGFTQAELDAFQADAERRGQIKQQQLTRGINLIRNPQNFSNINIGGFGFAQGGVVPPLMGGIGSLGLPALFIPR